MGQKKVMIDVGDNTWERCSKIITDLYKETEKYCSEYKKMFKAEDNRNGPNQKFLGKSNNGTVETLEGLLKEIDNDEYYKNLNVELNKIAQSYDILMEKHRSAADSQNNFTSKHVFLVTNHDKDETRPVTATIFCPDLPPDIRLIRIRKKKKEHSKEKNISVYHEMGHYMGPRMRKERFVDYLLPMFTLSYLNCIYRQMCGKYANWDDSTRGICCYDSFFNFSPAVNQYAYRVKAILDKMYSSFESEIKNNVELAISKILKFIYTQLEQNNNQTQKDILSRMYTSYEKYFLCMIRPVLLKTFSKMIEKEEFVDSVIEYTNEALSDEFKTDLKEAFKNVNNDYIVQINQKKIPEWYSLCENQLEEPVADLMMIREAKLSFFAYMTHILRGLQEALKEDGRDISTFSYIPLLDEIRKDTNSNRIISIALAYDCSGRDFSHWCDFLIRLFPNNCKSKQRYLARQSLKRMFHVAKEHPTSYQTLIFKYVKGIYEKYQGDEW